MVIIGIWHIVQLSKINRLTPSEVFPLALAFDGDGLVGWWWGEVMTLKSR